MDRKIAPPVKDIRKVILPRPEICTLSNGITIFGTQRPGLPVLRLEIVVMAGRPFERKKIISKLTGKLLKEGTTSKSSRKIADIFDKYGATIHTSANLDYVTISVHCLRKYFFQLWPVVYEILREPAFPEAELNTYVANNIQKLEIDLTKPEVVAYRLITEKIFGNDHPYGYNSTPELYRQATRADITEHYQRAFIPSKTNIHISGGYEAEDIDLIAESMGAWQNPHLSEPVFAGLISDKPGNIHIEMPTSSQASLRIGRRMFSRSHPDFMDVFILNTLLGGFFGSRLNMNIREGKGMTYSIGSSLDPLSYSGCLIIMADVSHEHIGKATRQVFKEFKKLREIPIDNDELTQLKRYLIGSLINAVDGPFHSSAMIKYLIADQVDLNIWDKANERICDITTEEIQHTAQQYLKQEDYWIVSAGINT